MHNDLSEMSQYEAGLYALPIVGRAGLGNMLFPWARSEVFARDYGARILSPIWGNVRIGPYFRREPEKRNYRKLFHAAHHVHGFLRTVPSLWGKRFSEVEFGPAVLGSAARRRPCVVVFKGNADLFTSLLAERDFIRHQLWAITSETRRVTSGPYGETFIAMHIRRGDITRQGFTREQLHDVAQYTPTSWFVSMARAVRSCPELDHIPIVVFTDGSTNEVAAVLRFANVYLHRRRTALEDIWTIGRASLLFASGFSTFGMWASYLGGMPTLYAPGKIAQRVQTGSPTSVEIEVPEDGKIPSQAMSRVIAASPDTNSVFVSAIEGLHP
jgi:hypothetical protein